MNVLMHMKIRLLFEASVTVHAAPKVVLVVHLTAELVVTSKGRRSRTNHEALLTLYRSICIEVNKKCHNFGYRYFQLIE